jgi:NAD-dependent SIR2 family protein deacetylase
MKSTENYSDSIQVLKEALDTADAIVIGAGAGLSTAAGFTYSGERFTEFFSDFEEKYGFHDMYSGSFYTYKTPEESWGFWSRMVYVNRYMDVDRGVYQKLFQLVKNKDYFVLTTNVDHQFQKAGFEKKRLFYTQGDYGLFQCSVPCHAETYDNETAIKAMIEAQKDLKIPTELIPKCPKCGEPLAMNLRSDDTFVQDSGWYAASRRYHDFLETHREQHVLFLELGVGYNTPAIIKYPFWKMTLENKKAFYACLNFGQSICPDEIADRAVCIDGDIRKIFEDL